MQWIHSFKKECKREAKNPSRQVLYLTACVNFGVVWILWASATGVYIQNRWAKRKSNFGFKLESSFRKLLLVLYCNATMDKGSNWSYHKAVAYCNSEGLRLSWYQSTHFHFNYLAVMSIRALPATYKVDFLFLTQHIFYRAKSNENLTIWQDQQSF